MFEFTLNPGFVPILAGLIVLAAPRIARAPIMALAALAALWLVLGNEFGAAATMRQMGVETVPLDLDALNRIFGIVMLILLIAIAIYTGARRNRYEDAAILMLAGGAVSALFVGDLVFLVAAVALSGLAAAWIVFASPLDGARFAGVRLLIWHGLEGLLFLIGVALHLTATAGISKFVRLDAGSISGACIFAALLLRIGAPFAHVWLKDVVSHASAAGGAALTAFSTMLGVYALARLFPAEPLLAPIGGAMIVVGLVFAVITDDLRRAAAYALTAQTGVCVALIGEGSRLSLAAAEGHAFAALLGFAALQMVLGALLERGGVRRLSEMKGVARAMPITSFLHLAAALACSAVPGFALYATQTVALDAMARWELRWLWLLVALTSAVLFVVLALRPTLEAHRATAPRPFRESPFPMMLGASLATFLCFSIGVAPQWLYALMPTELAFQPYEIERLAPQLALIGAAGVAYLASRGVGLAPAALPSRTLDVDAFYRGPVAGAGRWAGVLLLRAYGAWQAGAARAGYGAMRMFDRLSQLWDRPFAPARSAAAAQFLAIGAFLLLMLLFR
ncbi:MAG TPA: proton-conducting transporter membrane subunit [Vitreimonas sp.]|uniref:proton-conducting transporter transmembrane domain-containing protein n=1 Tax=Vitreimonas sp. TaxID=3069702 RepID=UPI002D4356A4|nr:proton-conducting transporter membrane subunit [Vitreimonas sp.]HYD89164.1 proton-conducting transporter membrane subunit [Vitreimonas sp.]